MNRLLTWGMVCGLVGCSGLQYRGTLQEIEVITPHAPGAKCEITDRAGRNWKVATTPAKLQVALGGSPLAFICSLPGHHSAVKLVESNDALLKEGKNAFYGKNLWQATHPEPFYPTKIMIWLMPERWRSETARQEWIALRREAEHLEMDGITRPEKWEPNRDTLLGDGDLGKESPNWAEQRGFVKERQREE